MNLIENNKELSSIVNFRQDQYRLIPDLLRIGINYLINLGLEYDPLYYSLDGSKIEYIEDYSYVNYNHFSSTNVKIRLTGDKSFFSYFSLPNLVNNMFFQLNGGFYIPKLYISDEPCVIKENSSIFYSLFSPLSMYSKEKRFTFIGSNYKLNEFLSIIIDEEWDSNLLESICEKWELQDYELDSNDEILEFFGNKFQCDPDIYEVRDKINQLFFDPWTEELYSKYYNILNPDISLILKNNILRILNDEKPSFIDLRFKRLVWIEYILKPYFKSIGDSARLLLTGRPLLRLSPNQIIDHFYSKDGLNGNEFYSTTNGFSGLGLYKASILNPFGTSNPPSEISSIHITYKGKICPNSVSNKDTGKEIFLVPDQYIDPKFGIFKF